MFSNDDTTAKNILRLQRQVAARTRPILLWIGAGASAWNGYPLWESLAKEMHSEFTRYVPGYDAKLGTSLLSSKYFPKFFSLLKQSDPASYATSLNEAFQAQATQPIYQRFITLLMEVHPLFLLTTNVDECLESHLKADVLQHDAIERCADHVGASRPFICKLHGTVSSPQSMVFTEEEYAARVAEPSFIPAIRTLFATCSVVFLGTSITDTYVLELIDQSDKAHPVFGDGPHFAVRAQGASNLPVKVHEIRYVTKPFTDHRSALNVLSLLAKEDVRGREAPAPSDASLTEGLRSAFFISSLLLPGKWQSSQSFTFAVTENMTAEAHIGLGWTDDELPIRYSTAMHDFVVGMLCFDTVQFPLGLLSQVHNLLGSDRFWFYLREEIIEFVHAAQDMVVVYPEPEALTGGSLGLIVTGNNRAPGPLSVSEIIRKHLSPVPGKESEAERRFEQLEEKIILPSANPTEFVPDLTRGLLLLPKVRELLGIGDGVTPTKIPRWARFPVLRLAHVVSVGMICNELRVAAVQLPFGGDVLVNSAFSTGVAREWVESQAGYVLAGNLNANLASAIEENPYLLDLLVTFRQTPEGRALRQEVLHQIQAHQGAEFVASVNGGLSQSLPSSIMQSARDRLVSLRLPQHKENSLNVAVLSPKGQGDRSVELWRKYSAKQLEGICRTQGIGFSGPCPCGSGDQLRHCCGARLRLVLN